MRIRPISALITTASLVIASGVQAADAPAADAPAAPAAAAAPASPHTITSNVNIVSDYKFRGLTQSWGRPAVQGGFDYAHSSGFYLGTWLSNVSGNQFPGGAALEWDYYGGYNGKINDDFGWTVGGYGYYYPGANLNYFTPAAPSVKPNTFELNAGVSWKWVSLKYSRTITDFFGANRDLGYQDGTKGSGYWDFTVSYPVADDLTLMFHAGKQSVKSRLAAPLASGTDNPDYSDYKLGITKTFKDGWNVGLAYVKASNSQFYDNTAAFGNAGDTENLGDGKLILTVGRTF